MKLMLIFTFLAMLSFSAKCQLEKNTWLLGGSGIFSAVKNNYNSTTVSTEYKRINLSLLPNAGYFIVDKFALGVRSALQWNKNTGISSNAGKSNITRFDYGMFGRYYFLKKEKQFNVLTDISYLFGNLNSKPDKGVRNTFTALAGTEIFFNSSVGLELLIGYQSDKEKLTKSTGTPQFFYTNINTGFKVSIGFQFHLQKD